MSQCPCNPEKSYDECCAPYHQGKEQAPSAEALMRARYSAYALCEIDYLIRSIPLLDRKKFDRLSAKAWSESADWKGLEIRSVEEKAQGTRAKIEFVATFAHDDEEHKHHELATFKKERDRWFFLDGKVIEEEEEE